MGNTNTDLFGRPVFEAIKGETLPMFHEPVTVTGPQRDAVDERIARKFDAAATPSLFGQTREGVAK